MSSKNSKFSWKQCIDDERCKVFPCIKGLKNYGNTDYFNALMQCLAGCDRFAEFLLCYDFVEYEENIIFNSFVNTIRCMWFNDPSVDTYFHKTISSLANENSPFCLSSQKDPHECMIWLLNKLNREFLNSLERFCMVENNYRKISTAYLYSMYESSKKDKKSNILKLFQGQFQKKIKCSAPNCGFVDILNEPFLSVPLKIPLPHRVTVKFISMNPARKITRFHFDISEPNVKITDIMEQIDKTVNISTENHVKLNQMHNYI
uniref:ubiquitinyl hydrolase 1 n=1 Tax=Meloidogyne enterolobii TaxID=390850 RepID=A0A6V7V9M9_MELEN|nr:unnamed protein product [Meloidogyne enterolobii]